MKSATYFNRKTFSRYDDKRVIAYLNEQVIESYTPEDAPEGFAPRTAYTYSGTEADGGTLIDAATDTRDDLINGIIRSRFTQTEEDAIKTHQLLRLTDPEHPLAAQYADEFNLLNIEREYAISTVDSWLAQ